MGSFFNILLILQNLVKSSEVLSYINTGQNYFQPTNLSVKWEKFLRPTSLSKSKSMVVNSLRPNTKALKYFNIVNATRKGHLTQYYTRNVSFRAAENFWGRIGLYRWGHPENSRTECFLLETLFHAVQSRRTRNEGTWRMLRDRRDCCDFLPLQIVGNNKNA